MYGWAKKGTCKCKYFECKNEAKNSAHAESYPMSWIRDFPLFRSCLSMILEVPLSFCQSMHTWRKNNLQCIFLKTFLTYQIFSPAIVNCDRYIHPSRQAFGRNIFIFFNSLYKMFAWQIRRHPGQGYTEPRRIKFLNEPWIIVLSLCFSSPNQSAWLLSVHEVLFISRTNNLGKRWDH